MSFLTKIRELIKKKKPVPPKPIVKRPQREIGFHTFAVTESSLKKNKTKV